MTANHIVAHMLNSIEETFKNFKPRPRYDIFKVEGVPSVEVPHKLTGY